MNIIIGNLIALIASLIMVYIGLLKNKKEFIFLQSVHIGLFALSNLILGGITGFIINSLSIFRNILCYKNKLNLLFKLILSFLITFLSLKFNNLGLIGLFPLISSLVYLWFMDIKNLPAAKLSLTDSLN